MSARDEVMRPYMRRRSAWEEGEHDVLRLLVRKGTRFLDVGANVGYFSVAAARLAPRVTVDSVEPHPELLPLLRFNLWSNGVHASVWPVALDERTGPMPLSSSENNAGDSRVSRPGAESRYSIVVPAIKADELFGDRAFDVVKIDVQGWELEVLLGMQRILDRSGEIAVVVEFWPGGLRQRDQDPAGVLARYRQMGFDIVVQRNAVLDRLGDSEIVALCDSAGENGQVNLVLRKR